MVFTQLNKSSEFVFCDYQLFLIVNIGLIAAVIAVLININPEF